MPPRALRFKRPLHRCNACDPRKAEVSGHAPQAAMAAPSGFQPATARSTALPSKKVAAPDVFAPSTSRIRAGRSADWATGQYDPPTGLAPISRRYQRRASLPTLWRSLQMVGHLGAAPSVCLAGCLRQAISHRLRRSVRRSEQRGSMPSSCPIEKMEPRGIAPRSAPCHSAVLLLNDGPEMERAPGLAPGKSGFAVRRLDDCGIARVVKWGDRRDSHPDLLVHSQKL